MNLDGDGARPSPPPQDTSNVIRSWQGGGVLDRRAFQKPFLTWAPQVDDSKLPPGKPHSIHAPCSREPLNDLCLTLSI